MKAIAVKFFSNRMGTLAVIIGKDITTGLYKAYIGACSGKSFYKDIETVLQIGSKFPLYPAEVLMDNGGQILEPELFQEFKKIPPEKREE